MISKLQFAQWCEGLSDYVEAGIDIQSYLAEKSKKDKTFNKYNKLVHKNLSDGKHLYQAIILPKAIRKPFYPTVLKTGELSGNITSTLKTLLNEFNNSFCSNNPNFSCRQFIHGMEIEFYLLK